MLGPGSYRARPKSRQRVKVWTEVAFPRRRAPAWGLVPGRGAGEHPWDCICGTEGRKQNRTELETGKSSGPTHSSRDPTGCSGARMALQKCPESDWKGHALRSPSPLTSVLRSRLPLGGVKCGWGCSPQLRQDLKGWKARGLVSSIHGISNR